MNFITISFGADDNVSRDRWFNFKSQHSTQRSAYREGLQSLNVAGTFGFVVIREDKDCWSVVEEEGTSNMSVSLQNYNYFVQPAPKLQLV